MRNILLTIALSLVITAVSAQSLAIQRWILEPASDFNVETFNQLVHDHPQLDDLHVVTSGKGLEKRIRFVSFKSTGNITPLVLERFGALQHDAWGELASVCDTLKDKDPGFYLQWGLENTGRRNNSKVGADISACEAWQFSTGDSSITVGFVDSGTKPNHDDLKGRYWVNAKEIPNNGKDDDNNGYIDDVNGWNVWSKNNDISDRIGHGTQVAGIVACNPKNNTGFVGMDWRCKVMTVTGVNNQGQGLSSWWAEGVYYLVDNGADIINLSLSSTNYVPALDSAVRYAEENGVLVVAATGNHNSSVRYPAKYETVFAVGATDHADHRALWQGVGSNFGSEIDVVAPGKAIYGINHVNNSTSYVTAGTSQATPLVTGLASLMKAMDPNITNDSIRSLIRRTADDQVGPSTEDSAGYDIYFGYGRINAYETLRVLNRMVNWSVATGNELPNTMGIEVYPNPVEHSFNVNTNGIDLKSIQVINTAGQVVFKSPVVHPTTNYRIDLPTGIYQLVGETASGQVSFQRLMVQ